MAWFFALSFHAPAQQRTIAGRASLSLSLFLPWEQQENTQGAVWMERKGN
jgi:hypothetical protein